MPVVTHHLQEFEGKVDLLLALAGAHAPIELDAPDKDIERIKPKAVVPVH